MRVALSIVFAVISNVSLSQTNFPALSPAASISQVVGFTSITVDYERPAVRGRKIFGELVPYGEVWRTGAGKCTRISFNEAVVIDTKRIAAGTYSLFTIPEKDEWTIILNSDTSLYSTGGYDVAKDVIRFVAKAESSGRFFESFTIDIDVVPNNAVMYLSWENTQVYFSVDTGADKKTVEFIDQNLMSGKSLKANEYAAAVEYFYFLDTDLEKAVTLIDLALARDPKQPWYYKLKVDVLEKQGNYSEALLAVRRTALSARTWQEIGGTKETLRV